MYGDWPVHMMLKYFPKEFQFIRHESKRSLRHQRNNMINLQQSNYSSCSIKSGSNDNVALYEDGHGYCFGCKYFKNLDGRFT